MLNHVCPQIYDFKPVANELYKNVPRLQQYQIFRMSREKIGCIECLSSPDSAVDLFDLRRSFDDIVVSPERAAQLFDEMECQNPVKINAEKVETMFKQVRPYVPKEFQADELYAAPSDEQLAAAMAKKRARLVKSKHNESVGKQSE
ncbi:hypothetical protein PINS_up012228 [Pythium insidiosum]|nr:hypothetical protein PINS_up012228 [Pythium insidiosum]